MKDKLTTNRVLSAETKTSDRVNARLVAGLTLNQWIEQETTPRKISLWGDVVEENFVPELCPIKEGNGQQLIYFGTLDQRPYYWLMRISSKHDINDPDFDVEEIVINALEESFGRAEPSICEEDFIPDDEYETYDEYFEASNYPRVDVSGYHWGLIVNMVSGRIG